MSIRSTSRDCQDGNLGGSAGKGKAHTVVQIDDDLILGALPSDEKTLPVAREPAHTREAKLGCVFTQTAWDKEGHPIRDPDSTSYAGAIETAEEFGKRLYLEAWNRGWSRAKKKVVIGDGAEWIWNLAKPYFPGAVQIVDLYHARQHPWELARKLFLNDEVNQKAGSKSTKSACSTKEKSKSW